MANHHQRRYSANELRQRLEEAGLAVRRLTHANAALFLPTAVVASLELRRRGVGNLGEALRFGTVGAIAAAGGALLALLLPASTLKLVFAVLLGLVGLGPVDWLSDPSLALWSVSLVAAWASLPFAILILRGGLLGIPREVFEAAALDG